MNHPYADIRTFDFRGLLNRDLIDRARPFFERHAERIAGLKTVAAAQAYQREKRALIVEMIGGLPPRIRQGAFRRTARINPRETRPQITGRSEYDGVALERVVFQSTPGVFVTALLHRPLKPAPRRSRPAVLFACGHSEMGKHYVAYLAVQRELALNGFVVLAVDPPGQGERHFIPPFRGSESLHGAVAQHFIAGIRADLTGRNIARWFVADLQSGIDVLCRVPEVDPRRIGLTGASGGGTQTSYLAALDTRIAAAAPCVYITDRQQYLESGQMHDHEQNFFRAFSAGICHHDFLILTAPRPLVVLAGRSDFFPIEGARQSVARARQVYGLFKSGRDLELFVTEERHGYTALHRHKATDFFRRHLGPEGLIGKKPLHVGAFDELPFEAVHATRSGQLLGDLPQIKTLPHLVAAEPRLTRLPKPAAGAAKKPAARRATLVRALSDYWNLGSRLAHPATRPVDPRSHTWPEHTQPVVRDCFFFTEPKAAVFVREIFNPARVQEHPPADALVLVPPKAGLRALPDAAWILFRKLALSGTPILLVCPRGIGPNRTHSIAQDGDTTEDALASTERTQVMNYIELGTPLAALQACDIAGALSRPRSPLAETYAHTRLHLAGWGTSALPVALAALFSPRPVASLRLGGLFGSLGALVDGPPLPIAEEWNVFGLLQYADIPQLCALANADAVSLVQPIAPDGSPFSTAEAQRLIARPFERCRGQGARPRLSLHCRVPEAHQWTALAEGLF